MPGILLGEELGKSVDSKSRRKIRGEFLDHHHNKGRSNAEFRIVACSFVAIGGKPLELGQHKERVQRINWKDICQDCFSKTMGRVPSSKEISNSGTRVEDNVTRRRCPCHDDENEKNGRISVKIKLDRQLPPLQTLGRRSVMQRPFIFVSPSR